MYKGVRCPFGNIMVEESRCPEPGSKCVTCGWNPKVNRRRRNQLRQLAKEGRLRTWGKE